MGILREMVEICAPILFLIQFVAMRWVQPKYNDSVCSLTDEEFRDAVIYVLVDISTEVLVGILTVFILRKALENHFAEDGAIRCPIRMLQGLVQTNLVQASSVLAMVCIFLFTQHSHSGQDS